MFDLTLGFSFNQKLPCVDYPSLTLFSLQSLRIRTLTVIVKIGGRGRHIFFGIPFDMELLHTYFMPGCNHTGFYLRWHQILLLHRLCIIWTWRGGWGICSVVYGRMCTFFIPKRITTKNLRLLPQVTNSKILVPRWL